MIFDTEEIKNDEARTDHLKKEQFTANCITFCDAVEEAGYETMIYANMKWMAFTLDLNELAGYKKWYADYEPLPQCPYEFSMWQYTEKGKVPGIEGNVDLNLCFDSFGSE
ncbi:MAG: GH25 family lysozyme [[Clostridium] scindens]